MQIFAEQAARRAVYIVLTAAILVPVWVATRPQTSQFAQESAPLDAATPGQAERTSVPAHEAAPPVRASLTPMPSVAPAREPSALVLEFDGDSWVEIRGADGQVLESGLLKAGDRRSYAAGEVARMKLGNATAVRIAHQGQVQDLTPYSRANVARFTVSSDGSLAPPVE